ncbi:MAG TPA: CUAEP/CCAEP-tail radical SAM protein [Blastocatellia bacterium]|nr:CUAEP/CCAEP-tail radical SAM protein [Blastocatellia bacterium]
MEARNQSKTVLLISCYELGHQPAGVFMPAGFLRRAGRSVEALDVSVEGFDEERIKRAHFIGISVPMHTALRLGVRVAEAVRRINTECHICFYGLYAALNADYLLDTVADFIIGGEVEQSLVTLIEAVDKNEPVNINGVRTKMHSSLPVLARLNFAAPDRSALPPLERYARLEREGREQLVGYVEASRGCLHYCTHCPIPPVYGGRFFVVDKEIVLEDIRNLVSAGARHITFGDPDFLNGPTHSLRIARAMRAEFPELTFDFTAKIEHIIKHRALMPELAKLGCIFVVSAVESLSDTVLAHLEKGHTRADVVEALGILNDAGIALRPSFVAFTPWTTIDDYVEMLEFVESNNLIYHVDPVQYSIRLLVPPGSLLLSRPDTAEWIGRLNQETFTYEWQHSDARMDELHREVTAIVEQAARRNEDAAVTFYRILELAYQVCGDEKAFRSAPQLAPLRLRPPRLTEAWFC